MPINGLRRRKNSDFWAISGIARVKWPGCAILALSALLSLGPAACAQDSTAAVDAAREKVTAAPQDAKARYEYAKALRQAGKQAEAASELLEATAMDPSLYVAYHELSLVKARPEQLDEGIERLNMLKNERPKDLMLRVALSELLEQRGDSYHAAHTLVEIVYQNDVPAKYVARVQSRIHYLLSKAKDAHATEKAAPADEVDEENTLAPPLPEASLHRNLSASKLKDAKGQGFGHAPLIP